MKAEFRNREAAHPRYGVQFHVGVICPQVTPCPAKGWSAVTRRRVTGTEIEELAEKLYESGIQK